MSHGRCPVRSHLLRAQVGLSTAAVSRGILIRHPNPSSLPLSTWRRSCAPAFPPQPPCTPALVKPDGELVQQPEKSFFPPSCQADLSDVEGYEYPPPIECPDITVTEIERAVRKAAPIKAPGIDGITNGVLHQTPDILPQTLCVLFNECLQQGYCPTHFKETLTVVLRKPGKDDYTQPKVRPSMRLLRYG